MIEARRFFIGGAWVDPVDPRPVAVIDPATEEPAATLSLGGAADFDRAVAAARAAFPAFAATERSARVALLRRVAAGLEARRGAIAEAITTEMGAPSAFSRDVHVGMSIAYLADMADVLARFAGESRLGDALIVHEPIGVCGLITPWNWPLNQIVSKLAAALAAGCTVVLKPSEIAPLSALLLAEVLAEAGVPPGVFNLVNGDGPTVGQAIAAHPDIDMVSFTGSTRAGILVARAAADSVKRVHQELGGKSANIILPDADLGAAVADGVRRCFVNAGQSCIAPTRMLVDRRQADAAVAIAVAAAAAVSVGDPRAPATTMGPVASAAQYEKVERLIGTGIAEGATLAAGGLGRPEGLSRGYYVRPTVFAGVTPDMTIAREEIFGPVLSILSYDGEDEAVAIANGTPYGLGAYVFSGDLGRARRVGARLRAGRVYLNGAPASASAPFGGYKQSGNGRELGEIGLREFFEVKALLGYYAA
jgi:aldehyde dehydrogenase (NAD+)